MLYLDIPEPALEARVPADVLQRQRLDLQSLMLQRARPETIATYGFDESGLSLVRAGRRRHLPLSDICGNSDNHGESPETTVPLLLALDGQSAAPRRLLRRPARWQLWTGAGGCRLLSDALHPWALRSDRLTSGDGRYELLIAGPQVLLLDQREGCLLQLCPHRHEILTRLSLRQTGLSVPLSVAPDLLAQAFWISTGSDELLRWHPGSGRLSRFELGLGPLGALALAPDPRYLLLAQDQQLHYLDTRSLASLKSLKLAAESTSAILLAPDQAHWLVSLQSAEKLSGVVRVSTRELELGQTHWFEPGQTVRAAGFESLNPFADPAPNLATGLYQLGQLQLTETELNQARELGWPFTEIKHFSPQAASPAPDDLTLSASENLNLPGQALIPLPAHSRLMLLNSHSDSAHVLWQQDLTPLGLTRPLDVRQLPGERMLVTDGGGRVCELGPDGILWEMGAEQGVLGPVKAGWFRQGEQERFLIVDLVAGRVLACDREYQTSWEYSSLERPCDARLTSRGSFLIADSGLQAVVEIDAKGRLLRRIGPEQGLNRPMAVYETEGHIFILDSEGPALLRLDTSADPQATGPLSRYELTGPAPYFIEFLPSPSGPGSLSCLLLSSEQLTLLTDLNSPQFEARSLWQQSLSELTTTAESSASQRSDRAGREAFLRALPLFQSLALEPEALCALAEAISEVWAAPGQTILSAGDSGEAMFLIGAGRVEILATAAEHRPEPVIVALGPGDVFGEISLFFAEPRSNTIQAARETRLLRLSKRAFHRLGRRFPAIQTQFETMAVERRRLVQQRRMDALQEQSIAQKSRFALERLRQLDLFQSLSAELLELLRPHLQFKALSAGAIVFEQGEPGRELYFISRGILDVYENEKFINTLPEAEVFGEIALVLDIPRTATVSARTYCELYSLNRDSFELAMALSPELRARLESLARQRLARSESGDFTLTATKLDQVKRATHEQAPLLSSGQSSLNEAMPFLLPESNLLAAVSPTGRLAWTFGRHDPQQLLAPFTLVQREDRLLIADRGNHRILLLDLPSHSLITSFGDDQLSLLNPTSADLSGEGRILIADQGQMRLLETDARQIFWQFQDPARLLSPVWVEALPDGQVLYADDVLHQVYCIDRQGQTLWSYGTPLFPGREYFRLNAPRCVTRLPNQNILISDTGNNRLLEISPDKAIVWHCGETDQGPSLQQPTWARRLSNGHTLIQHNHHSELLEVNSQGEIVWKCQLA